MRDIQYIKGVGEKRAADFKKLGVSTVEDLLRYYPRGYVDYSDIKELYSAVSGSTAAFKCRIVAPVKEQYIRKNMTVYKFAATDDSALLQVTIFNNRFLADKLKLGETYIFYGKIGGMAGLREMISPEIVSTESAAITPIYPTTAGLYQSNIRKVVKNALEFIPADPIPQYVLDKFGLCDLKFALRNIHFPKNNESLQMAKKRLIFEELFLFRIGIAKLKSGNKKRSGIKMERLYLKDFAAALPFTLTDSQTAAIRECAADMMSARQMNRLLEGDVGSGKTAVAAALMHSAALNGMQSALMAPTEILAEQHYNTLKSMYENTDIKVALLIGSTKKSEKTAIKSAIESGEIQVVVGTQALIQGDVNFCRLGLVVTDEQHRFGVMQRAALADKGAAPHVLVMSATPIPRTLALILYGELDISILSAPPRGRKPIKTYRVNSDMRPRLYNFIKKHIAEGHSAYIVCPLVEEGENDIAPAKEYYLKLKTEDFIGYNVGLLHGKLKPKEKEEAMRSFMSGETKLLVATTVVEVGVDVPEATVMIIENAERFGLSQLHQLRGRVGRGSAQSFCILVSDAKGEEATRRFGVMCETTDGFRIADEDLKLRGPGDFLGNRQHGLPLFKIADLTTDMEVLKEAGRAAELVLGNDFPLEKEEHKALRRELGNMFRSNTIN